MGGLPYVIYDTKRVRIRPKIDGAQAITLLVVQWANVAREEARQVLNEIDFTLIWTALQISVGGMFSMNWN